MPEKQMNTAVGKERRAFRRVPLDEPVLVKVRIADGEEMLAMLVDCGRGGVQLALSPGQEPLADILGNRLSVHDLPKAFRCLGDSFTGRVTWVSQNRCGIRFDTPLPLTDRELMHLTSEL